MLSISDTLYGIEPNIPVSPKDYQQMLENRKLRNDQWKLIKSTGWKYRGFKDERAAKMACGRLKKKLGIDLVVYEYLMLGF